MEQTYSKNYFEKYAALSLIKILSVNENQILQSDCPDLQIPSLDYGIEVTQALTPEEAVEDKKKQIYSHLHHNPFDSHDENIDFLILKIQDAFKRKQLKSNHYIKFKNNALYIFTHCYNVNEAEILSCFQNYDFKHSFYQYFYFNCMQHIFLFNANTSKITKYTYSLKELDSMNYLSLQYEKTCHKKRRKIIL